MSLTSFIKNKEVRQKFVDQFPKPKFKSRNDPIAPCKTSRCGMVGTAFDYLLRFMIENRNAQVISSKWFAENALVALQVMWDVEHELGIKIERNYDLNTGEISLYNKSTNKPVEVEKSETGSKIINILKNARNSYNNYLSSGEITENLIHNVIKLAQLESIARRQQYGFKLGMIYNEDVEDLRALTKLVDPSLFVSKQHCILNPSFGRASSLVRGADADLIIDGTLIEIKTVKKIALTREIFLQLMGYYILAKIGSIPNVPATPTIERVGIYFSRYGELIMFPISEIVNQDDLPNFLNWFEQKASEVYKS